MGTNTKIYERAMALADQKKPPSIELARVLHRMQQCEPEQFKEFYENSRIKRRTAFYLAEVGKCLEPLGLPSSRLEAIGWSKIQVIAKHLTARNAEKLLKLAEKNTTHGLAALMRKDDPMPDARCVLLRLSPQHYRKFEEAVLQNGGTKVGRGLRDKERALMKIIGKFAKSA
jgi:hypothetical protein